MPEQCEPSNNHTCTSHVISNIYIDVALECEQDVLCIIMPSTVNKHFS